MKSKRASLNKLPKKIDPLIWPADFKPLPNGEAKPRVFIVVLDAVGVGQHNSSKLYEDHGANTLKSVLDESEWDYPTLTSLGLGKVISHPLLSSDEAPLASVGIMSSASAGKDTTTGHWELGGHLKTQAFPTYPNGFPQSLIIDFEKMCGRKVIGNRVASGTQIIDELGAKHMETGALIVYTSADSVFQIAAHEELVPLDELYQICQRTRDEILVGEHALGRVIARPFVGSVEEGFRRTANRHDYSIAPSAKSHELFPQEIEAGESGDSKNQNPSTHSATKPATIFEALVRAGKEVVSVGKIFDIFAAQGFSMSYPTASNAEGMERLSALLNDAEVDVVFANLVDFDMVFGHRRDLKGFAQALQEFDTWLESFVANLSENDLLLITADHGCDPDFKGTDHTDEDVFLIAYSPSLQAEVLTKTTPYPNFLQLAKIISSWLQTPFELTHDQIDLEKLMDKESMLSTISKELHELAIDNKFYLVGGALRELLSGREVKDIDFAFSGSYQKAIKALSSSELFDVIKTNPEFGTARLKYRDTDFDIANFRTETYDEKSNYPLSSELQLNVGLENDYLRRDFSLNSLYLDIENLELFDPACGIIDLFSSELRILKDESFDEDPSRIIRGINFCNRYSYRFSSATGEQANRVIENPKLLKKLSLHRRQELDELLNQID